MEVNVKVSVTENAKTPTLSDGNQICPKKKRSKLSLKGAREASIKGPQKLAPLFKTETEAGSGENKETLACGDQTTETPVEVQRKPNVASIHNLGNTCYLNSVLQVLRHTPGFVDQIRDLAAEVKVTKKEKELVSQVLGEEDEEEILTFQLVKNLSDLYRKMALAETKYVAGETEFLAVRPYDLMDTIERLNPMFEGNLQHDAHELLSCILAYIQDAAKEINKFRTKHQISPKTESVDTEIKLEVSQDAEKSPSKVSHLSFDKTSVPKTPEKQPSPNIGTKVFVTPTKGGQRKISHGPAEGVNLVNGVNGQVNGVVTNGEYHNDGSQDDSTTKSKLVSKKGKQTRKRKCSTQEVESENDASQKLNKPKGRPRKKQIQRNGVKNRNAKSPTEMAINGKSPSDDDIIEEESKGPDGMEVTKPSLKNQPDIMSMLFRKPVVKRLGVRGNTNVPNGHCEGDGEKKVESAFTVPAPLTVKTTVIKTEIDNSQSPPLNGKQTARKTLGIRKVGVASSILGKPKNVGSVVNGHANGGKTTGARRGRGRGRGKSSPPKIQHTELEPEEVKGVMEELENLDMKTEPDDEMKSSAVEQGQKAVVKLEEMTESNKYFPLFERQKDSIKAIQSDMDLLDQLGQRCGIQDSVEKVFQGTVALRTRCLECENFTERREDYQDVGVPIRKEELEDGWPEQEDYEEEDQLAWIKSAFHEVEHLDGDNKYYCDKCLHLVEAERSMHYVATPNVLTLHLKRFATTSGMFGGLTKINDYVVTPEELPCMQATCGEGCSKPDHRYQLYAMITHTGISISSGHYVAYVRAPDTLIVPECPAEESPQEMVPPVLNGDDMMADPNNNADTNNNLGCDSTADRNLPTQNRTVNGAAEPGECSNNPEGMWIECDDDNITVLTAEDFERVLSPSGPGSPYLLFYKRIEEKMDI